MKYSTRTLLKVVASASLILVGAGGALLYAIISDTPHPLPVPVGVVVVIGLAMVGVGVYILFDSIDSLRS